MPCPCPRWRVIIAGASVVASPIDGMGPADEVAAGVFIGTMIAGFIHDQVTDEQTTHREDDTNQQQQENEKTQPNRKTEDGGKSDGRQKPKPPRLRPPNPDLIPDSGKDEHEAMNELRRKGIPQETIIDWSDLGYDVVAMNEALNEYQDSGESLLSVPDSTAQGDLGEIVAKQKVKICIRVHRDTNTPRVSSLRTRVIHLILQS